MVPSDTNSGVWAVLPLKGLQDAKKRLANILSPNERSALVTAMAQDMLSVLTSTRKLDGVLVISDDDDIKNLVENYPVELVTEGEEKGLNGAISHATSVLMNRGINAVMIIHGDIPLARPKDINAVIDACLPTPSVTISPCSQKDGTNVMVCSPPNIIPFHYGRKSFSKHIEITADKGMKPTVVFSDQLALDIDTGDDLRDLLHQLGKGQVGEQTTACIQGIDLENRLN